MPQWPGGEGATGDWLVSAHGMAGYYGAPVLWCNGNPFSMQNDGQRACDRAKYERHAKYAAASPYQPPTSSSSPSDMPFARPRTPALLPLRGLGLAVNQPTATHRAPLASCVYLHVPSGSYCTATDPSGPALHGGSPSLCRRGVVASMASGRRLGLTDTA